MVRFYLLAPISNEIYQIICIFQHQLKSASPITSGFGLKLMQKMGWRPGQGLGKYEQGPIAPFEVDIKVDKRGN